MELLVGGGNLGEPGLYISLEEKPERMKANLSSFGWNLDTLEHDGKITFIDATELRKPSSRIGQGVISAEDRITLTLPEVTLGSLLRTVRHVAAEEGTQRIIVDPINSLMLRYPEEVKRRKAMLLFFDAIESTGCSCLMISELRTSVLERRFQLEEFLSEGIVLLHTMVHEGNVIRGIQIEKMRGVAHDTQLRPYQISDSGVEVFPKDRIF